MRFKAILNVFFSNRASSCLFYLVSLLIPFSLNAQVYPYRNYSVKEGLLNSNVYSMAQDTAGYIWFGTENGLSKFNGLEFLNYSINDLGLGSHITSIYALSKKLLYVGTGMDGIYRFNTVSRKAERVNKNPVSQSNQIIVSDSILISLHEYHNLEFILLSTGEQFAIDTISRDHAINKPLMMTRLKNGNVIIGRKEGLYEWKPGGEKLIDINQVNGFPVYSVFEKNDGSLLIGTDGAIKHISGSQVIQSYMLNTGDEKRVRNIITDTKNNIWFNIWGTPDLFMLSEGRTIHISKFISSMNIALSRLISDREGNIWIGSLGKGAYLFTNNHLVNYPATTDFPAANLKCILPSGNGNLLSGTNDGIAWFDQKNDRLHSLKHMPEMTQFVRDVVKVDENRFVVAITDIRLVNPLQKAYPLNFEHKVVYYAHGSSLLVTDSELLVGNWDNSILKYDLDKFEFKETITGIFPDAQGKMRINCMVRDYMNRIWIGSQKGLCILDQKGKKYFPPGDISEMKINAISQISGNEILVTGADGFFVFENNPDPQLIKVVSSGVISNTTCFTFTGKDEYLAGTNEGLIYFYQGAQKTLSIHDGVLSENINDLLYLPGEDIAWVATAEGLMKINMDLLRSTMGKSLDVKHFQIKYGENEYVPVEGPLRFDFTRTTFSLKFEVFHYQNPFSVHYQYRIGNGEWQNTRSGELQLAAFSPGDHNVEVRAGFGDGKWGVKSEMQLYIVPPFYRTWWFYSMVFVTALLLVLFFFRRQIKIMRLKQEAENSIQQKIVELQQKALASNLNPHFIFNSLNSIQHFINTNNKFDANDYLAKFSRLMRMHLNMADKGYISLQEEISRLGFYLSLEQMRFGEKMKWDIKTGNNVDIWQVEIPNMIIQPFVENAIWHGIMPADRPGEVLININMTETGSLEILVADNGVGLNNASSRNDKNHQSKGVKLIADRLMLLNGGAADCLQFTDNNPGTLVRMILTPGMFRLVKEKSTIPQ